MSNAAFNYTDRDFVSIRNQLADYLKFRVPDWNPDPSDFAYSMIEAMAYLGDMMSYYVDRAAQESNILTANDPENVFALASLHGYSPGLAESAWCEVTFTNTSPEPVTIAKGTLVAAQSGGFPFEVKADIHIDGSDVAVREVLEGTSKYVDLGVSDGSAGQRFLIPDTNVDGRYGTLSVLVWNPTEGVGNTADQEIWGYRELLIDAPSGEYVFSVRLTPNGTTYIVFGDGVAGRIPQAGWNVSLYYRTTNGALGNAPGATLTRFLASWDDPSMAAYSAVTVSGESPSGGQNIESVDSIRRGAIYLTRAQRRAVTSYDYENLARQESKVQDAVAEARVWSRPTIWASPRETKLMLPGNEARLDEFCDYLETLLETMSLAGVDPVVKAGFPHFFKVNVEIVIPSTIDETYAVKRVQTAVSEAYSWEKSIFSEPVSVDGIVRAIGTSVPTTIVSYARVQSFSQLNPVTAWSKVLLNTDTPADWVVVSGSVPPEVKPAFSYFAVLWRPEDVVVQLPVTKIKNSGRSRF